MTEAETPHRPWGFYEVLADEPDHKVKRITVNPGGRLSLQRHQQRVEHWYAVKGKGVATLGDKLATLSPGSSVDIPIRTIHRVENK